MKLTESTLLTPRYYQNDSVREFFKYIDYNPGKHPVIVLPTGCVSADTIINENRCTLGRKKRIDHIYRAFNGLRTKKRYNYDKNHKTFVRSLTGDFIQLNEVEHVSYSGVKDLLKLTLENGNYLKATPDHKIMTADGWKRMDELSASDIVMCDTLKAKKSGNATKNASGKRYKGDILIVNLWLHPYASKVKTCKEKRGYTLRVEKHRAVFEANLNGLTLDEYKKILKTDEEKAKKLQYVDPSIYDIHHIDGDPYNNEISNLSQMTKRDHQVLHSKKSKYHFNQGVPVFSKVVSVEYFGKDHTYDIGCYENHNFVANGIVVHNSGKSLVMAMIILEMLKFEGTRVLVLAHRSKLLEQNAQELTGLLNNIFYDVGIYSASLKQRDTKSRILFAGIQSVYNKAWELGFFDMILVDEAHRINIKSEGMYRQFLDEQTKINPKIVIGGLTATAYRMKGGMVCDSAHEHRIFDDICYEVSIRELMDETHYKNLDKKQYLCPIISPSKAMQSRVDLSGVKIRGGEYVQGEMETAFMVDELIENTVNEILSYVHNRNKILIFTAGIKHCETVYETLLSKGCTAGRVHSKIKHEENEQTLKDFREGKIKFLLNIDTLTEGYNEKAIDCIAVLRATQSIGLWVQIVGRAFRLHPSKADSLILDFGGNIQRHGPVDKIEIRKHKEGTGRTVYTSPQKECPKCSSLVSVQALTCPDCGYEFPLPERHDDEASLESILSKWKPPVEYEVHHVTYGRHQKTDKPDSMRVDYHIDMGTKFSEYICLDHDGFAHKKAVQWVKKRTQEPIGSVDDALICHEVFRQPKSILVNENEKFPRIVSYIFETAEEEAARVKEKREAEEREINEKLEALVW